MSKLFLFSLIEIFSQVSLDIMVIIANSLIIITSIICIVLSLVKSEYGVKNRLWVLPIMVGVWSVQLWIELCSQEKVRYLFLTIGISLWILALILFLPQKNKVITEQHRNLARIISDKVKEERENNVAFKNQVFSSPIIKAEQRENLYDQKTQRKNEIDFSHVKSVLNKLEYYPLKEQDKKQAKDLENAIITAEQNQITPELKEKINDGLGALLKIMSKYAI